MRNVMVRCIFSALSVGICIVGILGQEIHRYQWSDQQVLADEWKPFVPGFAPRQVEPFPQRPDSSRQFFGKVPEPVPVPVAPVQQNLYKKSFQTAASANTLEPFVVPPILGTFNTFGLQTIQARNPLLDKNIKDNQFLDQGSHLHPKYFPQNTQQPQRFPPAFLHQQPQYLPNQQQHYPTPYRLETPGKPQALIQAPSKNIQTSVQIFPPNPPNNHYQPNAYFLGVPQKQENYEDDEASSRKQQPLQRPNDFLLNTNNIATIYGTRDPSLNIPPPALKPTAFIRNEQIQDQFLYDGGLKPAPQRYEGLNGFNKRPYEPQPIKHHELKKPHDDNPSKQVYEQLSQFSRPFSLPREPVREQVTEISRPKPEHNIGELNQNYELPVEHYKKEKPKTSHLSHKPAFDRIPPSTYPEVSTSTNLLDYEPGKLQSIKTVTYLPQRDVLQFNEDDVLGGVKQYQNNEKFNSFTRTPFLPTPTEAEDDHSFGTFQRLTTPPQKLTSTLPKNHKYFSIQHTSNRNRHPQISYNPEPPKYYTSTEAEQLLYDDKQKYTQETTQKPVEYENEQQYETTTRKSGGRRRKPSKGNKNKDQVRYKTTQADAPTTSAINNENYYAANDISTTEATIQYTTTKKKTTKFTTSKPEDDYPNYPQYVKQQQDNYPNYPAKQQDNYPNYPAKQQDNYPNYPAKQQDNYPNYPTKQQDNYPNYPKEYLQSGLLQNNYDSSNTAAEYFNSEKEEKENYPQQTVTSQSTTTTTTPEPTTSSLKVRIKNKYANSTRPRFSIKDYKRTSAASTPSTPTSTTESLDETADNNEKKPVRKFPLSSRSKNKTETTKSTEESTSEAIRKYKPRIRPNKYRSSTTTPAPDTTTERANTFKPSSTNRLKTSTSKYYNRFRTTTEITSNDAEEPSAASSDKKPIRTMLFSAKRSSVLKTRSTTPKIEEPESENVDETDDSPAPIVKKNANQFKPNTKLDKADDASQTNIMTSSEEQNEKKEIAEAAKQANSADKEIDITTSSEEESDDISSEVSDPKENEVTTPTSISIVADDRMDDADRVSKVSSLTSLDESDIPISFFQKWSTNDNQKQ